MAFECGHGYDQKKKYATKGERRRVEFRASADIRLENLTELICGMYVSK